MLIPDTLSPLSDEDMISVFLYFKSYSAINSEYNLNQQVIFSQFLTCFMSLRSPPPHSLKPQALIIVNKKLHPSVAILGSFVRGFIYCYVSSNPLSI